MPSAPMILAHLTLLHVPPPQLVDIAARAGYEALTLHITPPLPGLGAQICYPMLGASPMLDEVLARLGDTGLRVHDIQALRLRDNTHIPDFEPVFAAGARLGAKYAVTVCDLESQPAASDALGRLAELAAPFGIAIALEFMAYSGVKSLVAAREVLRQAGNADAVLMLDALHLFRSGGTVAQVAATDPRLIPYVQLCDAPSVAPDSNAGLRTEALTDRRLPGQGELPLMKLLEALPAPIALSVEAPSAALQATHSDFFIARLALEQTRLLQRQLQH